MGLSESEFWAMAPMQFSVAVAAWKEDQKARYHRDVALAWMVANFAGQAFSNTLPPLEKLIPGLATAHARHQDARLEAAADAMGLKVVRPEGRAA